MEAAIATSSASSSRSRLQRSQNWYRSQPSGEHAAFGNDAVLGRNRYVALNLSAKNGKSKAPLSPHQKPCKQMSEAIVVDGNERGRIVKVCADPACPVHFADRHAPKPEQ